MCAKQLNVLIGGGRGFIGCRLSHMLKSRGHKVTFVSRKDRQESVTWDYIDSVGLPEGTDAVVNVAGENVMNPLRRWSEQFREDLRKSRIETNRSLINAISKEEAPPKVFISSSAIGYYKADPMVRYTESSPSTGQDFMSQLCRDWEESAKLPESVKTRMAIVRIGLVLGREGGMIESLIVPFFLGLGGPVGSGTQWFPWVHVEDVAGVFTHIIEHDDTSGVYNAVAPVLNTNKEFSAALGSAMWRPAIVPTPGFALRVIFGEDRANMMIEGQQVIPERILEAGYKFVFPDLASACKQVCHILPGGMKV